MALSNKFGWLVLDDRQQVRDVGRLLDPLRRPRRRLRASSRTCTRRSSTGSARGATATPARSPRTRSPAKPADPGQRRRRRAAAARRPIPISIIERAPSAELRPDQRDEDSLPPYAVLDRDPRGLRRARPSREQLIAQGLPSRGRGARDPARRPRRVQAPPGSSRHQDHPARLRARPAHADHQPLPRVTPRAGEAPPGARVH